MGLMYPRVHGVLSGEGVNLPDGLIHLYEFENNLDLGEDSIASLDLTNVNGVTQDSGVIGNSSRAIGASLQHLETPLTTTELDLNASNQNLTFSVWVKVDDVTEPNSHSVFTIRSPTLPATVAIVFYITPTITQMQVRGSNGVAGTNGDPRQDGVWSHLLGVVRNGFHEFYIDGVLIPPVIDIDVGIIDQDANTVMRLFRGDSIYITGNIDQYAIWNRALNLSEIAAVYNGGSGTALL